MSAFYLGSLVMSLSGGPTMTVNRLLEKERSCECVWFSGDSLNIEVIAETALKARIQAGSLVMSRHDGPPTMTVNRKFEVSHLCECVWFDWFDGTSINTTLLSESKLIAIDNRTYFDNSDDVYNDEDSAIQEYEDCCNEDPFGNPIVAEWDDDYELHWYQDENGDSYTEEMGPPCNWPD